VSESPEMLHDDPSDEDDPSSTPADSMSPVSDVAALLKSDSTIPGSRSSLFMHCAGFPSSVPSSFWCPAIIAIIPPPPPTAAPPLAPAIVAIIAIIAATASTATTATTTYIQLPDIRPVVAESIKSPLSRIT